MPTRAMTTAEPEATRALPFARLSRIARHAYWPTVLGLVALNAWWWWDARPLPDLRMVNSWIGEDREVGSRSSGWWNPLDVPRNNSGALRVLRRAVRLSPNDGDARIMLGRALGAAKDFRGAAEQFRQVPYWSARKPEALFAEGMFWFQCNRARDGEAAYLNYVNVDPNHPGPRPQADAVVARLLELYALEDRWDEAHALIWRAYREAGPNSRVELLEMSVRTKLERSLPSAAVRELRVMLAADPEDWEARRAFARAANAEKLTAESDEAIRACLVAKPKDPKVWGDWLEILSARNDPSALAAAVDRVPPEAAEDFRVQMTIGRVRRQARDYAGAARAFAKAVEMKPYDVDAQFSLSQALRLAGRTKEAEVHARRHAELEPLTSEVPAAVNSYLDAKEAYKVDRTKPLAAKMKAAMLHLSSVCRRMGWNQDAEGWAKAAQDV